MKSEIYIPIQEISDFCHVDISILRDFAEYNLITIQVYRKTECVMAEEIEQIKRIIDLYRELGVNKEGIEIILSMRDQILEMQNEIRTLKQKLEHRKNDCKFRLLELPSKRGLLIDYDE